MIDAAGAGVQRGRRPCRQSLNIPQCILCQLYCCLIPIDAKLCLARCVVRSPLSRRPRVERAGTVAGLHREAGAPLRRVREPDPSARPSASSGASSSCAQRTLEHSGRVVPPPASPGRQRKANATASRLRCRGATGEPARPTAARAAVPALRRPQRVPAGRDRVLWRGLLVPQRGVPGGVACRRARTQACHRLHLPQLRRARSAKPMKTRIA